jgi:segregation and condensation protein B
MNESYVRNVIEAALLAAGKSLQAAELAQLFEDSGRPGTQEIQAALAALAQEYADRGIEIKETAAGFRIQVRRELANEISRLWPERPAKYSRALLETLALIAYRQPITRAEIEAVRGVAVNPNIIKTLLERNWVRVVGHRDVPGRPELLGTTREFLEYFGLRSLDELPPLAQLKSLGEMNMQLELPGAPVSGAGATEGVAEVAPEAAAGSADEPVLDDSASAPSPADTEDAGEDDELSADGSGSRELVAAPPGSDD